MARSEVVGGAFVFTKLINSDLSKKLRCLIWIPVCRMASHQRILQMESGIDMLAVMADEFVNFVLDQLSSLPELRAKAMFGGYGLYQGDRFFGIMMARRLYFKTNEKTVRKYLDHGMGPFLYEKARQTMTIQYYEVPPAILENRSDFVIWAREAIEAEKIKRLKRK